MEPVAAALGLAALARLSEATRGYYYLLIHLITESLCRCFATPACWVFPDHLIT